MSGSARDIDTDRQAFLEAALDQVREAVYLIDEHGRPQYVNDEAWRMLGHERAMLLSMSVWDVDPQRSRTRWARSWADLRRSGRRQFESEHRTRDGRLIPVEVAVSYVVFQGRGYGLALVRDISARKRAEQEFRALVENSPDTVARYDRECRRTYANPALARAAGLPDQTLLGMRPGERLAAAPVLAQGYEDCIRGVLESGCGAVHDLSWRGAHGEAITSQIRLVPERGVDGTVDSVLAIGRDITELRQAEQTIRELHRRREAAREEERRHIARELHDEMGQRLSALRMQVALLDLRGANPALRRTAEDLQAMVDQMIHVVRNLASSLRPPALDLGIAAALEWLVEDFRRAGGAACRLHVDEAGIALDAEQTTMVFRIVQESLTNVARHAGARRVEVTLVRSGGDCLLSVRDDGRGFDPAAQPQRSLGLVGLRERAQTLGGRLEIRSAPGEGTLLSVVFPA